MVALMSILPALSMPLWASAAFAGVGWLWLWGTWRAIMPIWFRRLMRRQLV
jgi:hypothetical protein